MGTVFQERITVLQEPNHGSMGTPHWVLQERMHGITGTPPFARLAVNQRVAETRPPRNFLSLELKELTPPPALPLF